MRVVRGLARLLLVVGVSGLLVAGCGGTEAPESEPPVTPGSSGEGEPGMFTLSSSAFADGDPIPARYCLGGVSGGRNISVPLQWAGAPDGTRSFAIAMVDRHPMANDWVHWVVVDIPATASALAEGASGAGMPAGARELENTFRDAGYSGPQPPSGSGDHDYEITVYALAADHVNIGDRPSAADIERALADHVLATSAITGTFGR